MRTFLLLFKFIAALSVHCLKFSLLAGDVTLWCRGGRNVFHNRLAAAKDLQAFGVMLYVAGSYFRRNPPCGFAPTEIVSSILFGLSYSGITSAAYLFQYLSNIILGQILQSHLVHCAFQLS